MPNFFTLVEWLTPESALISNLQESLVDMIAAGGVHATRSACSPIPRTDVEHVP